MLAYADPDVSQRIQRGVEGVLREAAGLPGEFSADAAIGNPQAAIAEWQRLYGKKDKMQTKRLTEKLVLPVTYQYQNDSTSEQGHRMCFSSSSVMMLEQVKPGCVVNHKDRRKGEQADDFYLRKLNDLYGDSTDAQAQLRCHRFFGVATELRTDGNYDVLHQALGRGHGVMVGWLHRGPVDHPLPEYSHWCYLLGWIPGKNGGTFVFHDPNGEANIIKGGYDNWEKGRYVQYSWANWRKRWMADSAGRFREGTGWYIVPQGVK